MLYIWVAIGSALGGVARYALSRWMESLSTVFPWGTVCVNTLGCFIIGFFGTYTLHGGKHPVSDTTRLFVMVGICGGFTTFSAFSLQTFDLLRIGAWGRALLNVVLSVMLCLIAVGLGHLAAKRSPAEIAIVQTKDERFTG